MTKTIPFARGLSLPISAVTETFGFIGRKGSGKTYGAGKLVEGMLDINAQVIVLDPVGVWYGLRAGSRPYDIPLLGGAHGDIPLEHTAGALIADIVIDRNTSAVLDVSNFSKKRRKLFVADFAERLFHRKKTKRTPVHVVFEEAQMFAPQRSSSGSERMLGAVEDIVRLGRNYGIGATLISQRPQSVNKEILNQVEALVVFQLNGAHERKAVEAWVVHQDIDTHEMVAKLPSLPCGTAFLWSPQWLGELKRIKILKKRSADTSATPTVKTKSHSAKPLSAAELKRLKGAMGETVAKAAQNDPVKLRKQVADLGLEIKRLERRLPTPAEVVEVPVVLPEHMARLQEDISELRSITSQFEELIQKVLTHQQLSPRRAQVRPPSSPRVVAASGDAPKLRAGALRMLRALGAFYPASMTKRQVAGAAKMKSTGGTFNTYWGELRRNALIEDVQSRWRITTAGFGLLGAFIPEMPDTLDGRLDYWRSRLRAGTVRILNELHERYRLGGNTLSKLELASLVGMKSTGGTFNTYLGILRNNGLVDQEPTGGYWLSEWIISGKP